MPFINPFLLLTRLNIVLLILLIGMLSLRKLETKQKNHACSNDNDVRTAPNVTTALKLDLL
jgi:hypothetical protein